MKIFSIQKLYKQILTAKVIQNVFSLGTNYVAFARNEFISRFLHRRSHLNNAKTITFLFSFLNFFFWPEISSIFNIISKKSLYPSKFGFNSKNDSNENQELRAYLFLNVNVFFPFARIQLTGKHNPNVCCEMITIVVGDWHYLLPTSCQIKRCQTISTKIHHEATQHYLIGIIIIACL